MKKIQTPYDIDDTLYESKEYISSLSSDDWKTDVASTDETKKSLASLRMDRVFLNLENKYTTPSLVRTSMNFYPEDLEKSKKIAEKLGVSYQVFIRDFLHENLKLANIK